MTDQQGSPVQLAVQPQPRPDIGPGAMWVQISVTTPVNFYAFSVPPEMVTDEFVDGFAGLLRDVAQECNRAQSGIVIANELPREK